MSLSIKNMKGGAPFFYETMLPVVVKATVIKPKNIKTTFKVLKRQRERVTE